MLSIKSADRDAYAGGAGGVAAPSALIKGGWRGKLALHTELNPSLLSSERAFSGIVDSLGQENCFWGKPQTPKFLFYSYETNILRTIFLEKRLKTKIHPCGGVYIYST